MGNLWPYKNHHYRPKYLIVLLQEHCEKIQFKSGHPVNRYSALAVHNFEIIFFVKHSPKGS